MEGEEKERRKWALLSGSDPEHLAGLEAMDPHRSMETNVTQQQNTERWEINMFHFFFFFK